MNILERHKQLNKLQNINESNEKFIDQICNIDCSAGDLCYKSVWSLPPSKIFLNARHI